VGVDGAVDTVANPLHLSRTPPTYRLAPPGVGEHSDEIRAELIVSNGHTSDVQKRTVEIF